LLKNTKRGSPNELSAASTSPQALAAIPSSSDTRSPTVININITSHNSTKNEIHQVSNVANNTNNSQQVSNTILNTLNQLANIHTTSNALNQV
jgi:hypothetical protein